MVSSINSSKNSTLTLSNDFFIKPGFHVDMFITLLLSSFVLPELPTFVFYEQ